MTSKGITNLTFFLFFVLGAAKAQMPAALFPPETISIHTPIDIEDKRQQLINYMWGASGWPTARVPDVIDSAFVDAQYASLQDSLGNLLRIDRYTIRMRYGFEAYIYHFIPMRSNAKVFIYHGGHGWGFQWEDKAANNNDVGAGFVIPELIREGYAVLGFSMPLQGNNIPSEPVPGHGTIDWMFGSGAHLQMFRYLENPFSFFFDPLIITLNYLEDSYDYERIYMTGLSGGGWTSVFYPALDTRINFSFPVAGSVPLYLRVGFEGVGDVEQGYDYNSFLSIANYMELYVMSSYGERRGQLQINNRYDACCFYGTRDQYWVDSVKMTLDNLEGAGRYNFFLDESHQKHQVSRAALEEIRKFIRYYEGNDSTTLVVSHPEVKMLCPGDSVVLSTQTAVPDLTYQWQVYTEAGGPFESIYDNDLYEGTDSTTLVIRDVNESMNGYVYRCRVMGDNVPTTASFSYTLIIRSPTSISLQPETAVLCPEQDVTFHLTAGGFDLDYKWQIYTGDGFRDLTESSVHRRTDTPSLVVAASADSLAGYFYRCRVSGSCGTTVSDSVKFVIPEPITLTAQPADLTVCAETDAEINVSAKGLPLFYSWQVNNGGGFNDLSDTVTYQGYITPALLIKSTPDSLDGFTYRTLISNGCDVWYSDTARLTVKPLVSIRQQPLEQVICPGQGAEFSVYATDDECTYQWQENDGTGFKDIVGGDFYFGYTTQGLVVAPGALQDTNMSYRAIVFNSCDSDTTEAAAATIVDRPIIIMQPADAMFCLNGQAAFNVAAIGKNLHYRWQMDDGQGFKDIVATPETFAGVDSASLHLKAVTETMDGYAFRCVVQGECNASEVYTGPAHLFLAEEVKLVNGPENLSLCPGAAGRLTVNSTGTGLHYQWQRNSGAGFESIADEALFDGFNSQSLLVRTPNAEAAGSLYRCVVTGLCGAPVITSDVSISLKQAAAITRQPEGATVCKGESVLFTVGANGTSLKYRWQYDDGNGFVDAQQPNGSGDSFTLNTSFFNRSSVQVRCLISGECGPGQVSQHVQLKILTLSEISLNGLAEVYCHDAASVVLTISPSGGLLTGKGITGSTYDPLLAGIGIDTVKYSITDSRGCANSLVKVTIVQDCESKQAFHAVSTYPNPIREAVQVVFESHGLRSFIMFISDMEGKKVLEQQYYSQVGDNIYEVDTGSLRAGLYHLTIVSGGEIVYSKKVIIRK